MSGAAEAPAAPGSGRSAAILRFLLAASLSALLTLQLYQFLQWARVAQDVLACPYQLDFGEGVVWQQARMILRGDGYTPLAVEPHIVFHYPPVFHLLSGLAGSVTGDMLAGGRLVSMLAALAAAGFLGVLFRASVADQAADAGRSVAFAIAAAVGLLFLGHPAVDSWSLLMRVDMAAIALGLAGAWLALRAPERPSALLGAAVCFALELYAKQSHLALPLASFGTLLLTAPRLAARLIGLTAALGLGALAFLQYATDGGFLTHVVGYNLNRIDLANAGTLLRVLILPAGVGIVGTVSGLAAVTELAARLRRHGLHAIRECLDRGPAERARVFMTLFFLTSTMLLPLALKSGASMNYFIEWVAALVLLTGLTMMRWIAGGSRQWPIAVILSLILLAQTRHDFIDIRSRTGELAPLAQLIADAPGPVLSDEMVMVIRSGRDVLWESAIHAELAALGRWDPEPFAQRIRSGAFALIVTQDLPGDPLFEQRYPKSISAAIVAAYPVRQSFGRYTAHLPARVVEGRTP